MGKDLSQAEKIIGYDFLDKSLLSRAFTHSSFTNEKSDYPDYERLEFLGDAILGLSVGLKLYKLFPNDKEGLLTKKRAAIVSAETLSEIIDEYGLIEYMRVGNGRVSEEVHDSENVKCDLFEAIVGAIYLDCGMDLSITENFIWDKLEKYIYKPSIDYKSKTIEYCVKNKIEYKIATDSIEEENKKVFRCELWINGKVVSTGEGRNKLLAEKKACKVFYDSLNL